MQIRAVVIRLITLSVSLTTATAAVAQVDPGSLERTVPKFEVRPDAKQSRIATPVLPPQASARFASSFVLSAVNIEGATVFNSEQLAPAFEPFLASQVGQAELDKIAGDITEKYRKAGYLLSYAMVPEQSVQSGIVRIRVVEGYVDQVRIEGDRRSGAAVRAIAQKLSADRPLRTATLERLVGLMRDVPGVVVGDVRLSRSPQDPARHQLTLALQSNRVRAVAYSDNRGTVEGARLRGYSSISVSSLAVPGDQFQLDLFSIPSKDFHFVYGQAKASMPIGSNGLRLAASASRAETFRRLSGPNQHGNSRQLVADLSYPFAKSRAFSLVGHLSFGDWRSEEKIAGSLIQRDRIQVVHAWAEMSRVRNTRIDARIGISQGLDLGPATELGDPLASRPFGKSEFTKLNVDLQVAAPISEKIAVRIEGSAQLSSDSLLAPEEFALGGSRIGRTFDFNELTGDHGVGGMAELSYRPGDSKSSIKALEIFAFADGGGAFRKRSAPLLPDEEWLASAGVGTRFMALGFLWGGEVGVPVARSNADRGVRAFFSITRAF